MNFNKIMLMGFLTRDPQLSYLPSQTPVVDFGIAVNRQWVSKEGEKKEEVCFVDLRAFGRTAENLNKYTHKGDPLFISGRLTFDQWTTEDGSKRSRHRVLVEEFQFLGGKQEAKSDIDPPPTDDVDVSSNKHRKDETNDNSDFPF